MVHENDLNNVDTRDKQLKRIFNFQNISPICQDEWIRIPLDLPWKEMASDINLLFEKYNWYGMVHRMHSDWKRSALYGGVGLTYNPNYIFSIPKHAQGLGQPRSTTNLNSNDWLTQTKNGNYEQTTVHQKNTYNDCLGLRIRNRATYFRSFKILFDSIRLNMFQGRIAEIRPHSVSKEDYENNKEFIWHVDEQNEIISRLLIPLVYSDEYYIEFADSGNKIFFEPGYAYHWNTKKIHRWGYDYNEKIKNRTCIVLGIGPWLNYKDNVWSTNNYFNRMHPTDMIQKRKVI